ncbi:hypothetical protein YC2023_107182 [Brassica napus]
MGMPALETFVKEATDADALDTIPSIFESNIIDNDHHQQLINGSENNSAAAASSRWNPTPEQITALEEIYRRGTRTPTTEQIQQIASKLSKYGRIEGKNVFYWFQNHKSRERLKRRRCEGDNDINSVHEPLKDVKDSSSGDKKLLDYYTLRMVIYFNPVLKCQSGGYRVDQTKIYASFPHTNQQPQITVRLKNQKGHRMQAKKPCVEILLLHS